jgi:hypothetical protein
MIAMPPVIERQRQHRIGTRISDKEKSPLFMRGLFVG